MKEFVDAFECIKDLELMRNREGYIAFQEKCRQEKKAGHRQVCCLACTRWKWPDERCNLFVPLATRGQRSAVSAGGSHGPTE